LPIIYSAPGGFDDDNMTWEDFVPKNKRHPFVTIDASPGTGPVEFVFERSDDGGYDAIVSPAITRETATLVLAAINKVDPSQIEIREGLD